MPVQQHCSLPSIARAQSGTAGMFDKEASAHLVRLVLRDHVGVLVRLGPASAACGEGKLQQGITCLHWLHCPVTLWPPAMPLSLNNIGLYRNVRLFKQRDEADSASHGEVRFWRQTERLKSSVFLVARALITAWNIYYKLELQLRDTPTATEVGHQRMVRKVIPGAGPATSWHCSSGFASISCSLFSVFARLTSSLTSFCWIFVQFSILESDSLCGHGNTFLGRGSECKS